MRNFLVQNQILNWWFHSKWEVRRTKPRNQHNIINFDLLFLRLRSIKFILLILLRKSLRNRKMIKNIQNNQVRLSKSNVKTTYSRNTLKEFKNTEKTQDFDVDQQSVKKMSQYETLAIKLGFMPKKVRSSKPHLAKQPTKMSKTHTNTCT